LVSTNKPEELLSFWRAKFDEFEAKSKRNDGFLKRQEWWERQYCETPYLAFATDKYIEQRFFDHFHNTVCLTSDGGMALRPDFAEDSGLIAPLFSHLMLEFQARGLGLPSATERARDQLHKYFVNGTPTGVKLFKNLPQQLNDVIVKFGKKRHLEPMLKRGEIRITPANFYENTLLLEAMQDFETRRWFHQPMFDQILAGNSRFQLNGIEVELEDGFFKFSVSCPNYVLWSACNDIDRRLPDDFEADAALIIRKPRTFTEHLSRKVKELWPRAPTWFGDVKYYDPCSFVGMKLRPETIKHFSYLYQREWRFCAFPNEEEMPKEPLIVSIGPLGDIAEIVTL
jgi:hypothetical protein